MLDQDWPVIRSTTRMAEETGDGYQVHHLIV